MNKIIDPWKSFEVKDYEKLTTQFGLEKTSTILKKLPKKHHYFSRNIVFGHRSLQTVLDAAKKKKPFTMLTGLMPSGKLHFGHKLVVDMMSYFQELGAECNVVVADVESYLTRNMPLKEARKIAIEEYLTNYIALGLKSKKTKFYFQSECSRDHTNLSRFVSKRTTFNELKSIYGELTLGKMTSVLIQMADILGPQLKENGGPKPVVVPVGIDQLPHINLARDVASRMKTEYKFIQPSATFHKLLPGLRGGKMSSSEPNSAIFLTDDAKTVENKIKKYAFSGGQATLAEHRKKGGNPNVDTCYIWLTYFEESDKKLKKIYEDYKSGSLLTSELKELTIKKINTFLKDHQAKRKKARSVVDKYLK